MEENIHNAVIATLLKKSNSEEWNSRLPEIRCLQISVLIQLTDCFRYFQILNRKKTAFKFSFGIYKIHVRIIHTNSL